MKLKVVRLLEPELCRECRFGKIADVKMEKNGVVEETRMVYCRRLDCDNWDTTDTEPARSLRPVE
jgi:hypothetical protein